MVQGCARVKAGAARHRGLQADGQDQAMYTLIATAKLNDINPQAWLADVLARIADHPASRLAELLPWHWENYPRSTCRRLML